VKGRCLDNKTFAMCDEFCCGGMEGRCLDIKTFAMCEEFCCGGMEGRCLDNKTLAVCEEFSCLRLSNLFCEHIYNSLDYTRLLITQLLPRVVRVFLFQSPSFSSAACDNAAAC